MAGITLYQIPGINREDTPVFSSKTRQDAWFSGKTSIVIPDGFYPPHYRNVITLELDLVVSPQGSGDSYETRWNYARIVFNDKAYYYFVDRIEYVNEDLVNFYVSLDTIQTYMFDISWIQSHITRKSIKRWVTENSVRVINRNYLRENFSSGRFILKEKKYYTYNSDFSSDSTDTSPITGLVYTKFPSDGDAIENHCSLPDGNHWCYSYSSCRLTYVPEIYGSLEYYIEWAATSSRMEAKDALNAVIRYHSDTIFAYYLPFDNRKLGQLGYVVNQVFTIPSGSTLINDQGAIKLPDGFNVASYILYDDISLGYTENTTYGADYSSSYIPQLIDESYMQVSWGEPTARSQFPLHVTKTSTLRLNYFGDVFTGKRSYYITTAIGNITPEYSESEQNVSRLVGDVYNTMTIANNLVTVDVNTSSFRQYYTYNAASSVFGVISAGLALAMLL